MFRIQDFKTRYRAGEQMIILVSGSKELYPAILRDAFHDHFFSRVFDDQYDSYDWGMFIHDVPPEEELAFTKQIQSLLSLLQKAVCIDDNLSQTFALDYHRLPEYEGYRRTEIAELVYSAKPYNNVPTDSHRNSADRLAEYFVDFIMHHPSYSRAEYMIAPPFFGADKPFDLPNYLVEQICAKVNIENGSKYLRKVRRTAPMKDITTTQGKIQNIRHAFEVDNDAPFSGKRLIVIDDIYQSGTTLNEIGTILQWEDAEVLGLVATKTLRTPH